MSSATESRAETTRVVTSGVVLVLVAVAAVSVAGAGAVAGDTTATDEAVVETQTNTSVGVVAEDADAGTEWANELESRFGRYDAEWVTSGQVLGNLSAYDAYLVLTLADSDTGTWFDRTDATPTLYTVVGNAFSDTERFGSKSVLQRSNTVGNPATVTNYTDGYLSWTVTTDHPLFDGVASPGDEVTISGSYYADGGSFTGARANVIADTNDGNSGVAVDDNRQDILLGSVGSSNVTGPPEYEPAAFAVIGNALDYYLDANATVAGTVTDTGGTPLDGVTVELTGSRETTVQTDANGSYEAPLTAGGYTLTASGFGYETTSKTVNVSAGETVTEDVSLSDSLDVARLDGQSDRLYAGESLDVEFDLANADTVTVENVGSLTSGLSLSVDGETAQFGDAVNVTDPDGTVTVSVETTNDTQGTVELEHSFTGAGEQATVTTGSTAVVDTLFSIAVIDDRSASEGKSWVTAIDRALENSSNTLYEVEYATTGDVLGDIDSYDAYFAHDLGFDNDDAFVNATDGVPTVYTSQLYGSTSLGDRSDVTGDPETVVGVSDMSSWAVTANHSLFDGVADPGDSIPVHGGSSYGAYFGNTSAELLATVPGDSNGTVAIDDDRRDVLLTSLGSNGYVEVASHSAAALQVLANALTEFVSEKATVEGQVTDTDGTPLDGVTVDVLGGPRQATTDANGSYELSVLPGTYTIELSAFGYETFSTTVTVAEDETLVENVTIAAVPEAAVLDGQTADIESGNATGVSLDVANTDTLTVESVGTLTGSLFVDGVAASFGDPVSLSDADGTVDVTVTTTSGTDGTVELEHTVAGVGDQATVTTGPTQVFDSFTEIGVVSVDTRAGAEWADAFDNRLVGYEGEQVTAGDALADLDSYDAYFVLSVGDNSTDWFSRTDDRPTLYPTTADGLSPPSLVERSDTLGDPAAVTRDDDLATWQVTSDHPLFDGVADPGERVRVHTDFFAEGASFTGTDADVLANARNGEGAVAIDNDRQDVLLGSVGSSLSVTVEEYTSDAFAVIQNAFDYYTAGSVTIRGTVTDTDGDPLADATVALADEPRRIVTDADGTYELPVTAGSYTLSVSAFGYESTSTPVSVTEGETVTENVSLDESFDVRLTDGQTGTLDSGTAIEVAVEVAGADSLTVENTGSLTGGLTLLVDGQPAQFGDPVTIPSSGTVDVTVETTNGTTGVVELEHTVTGSNTTETVTTGPTELFDELFSIGVVDDRSPEAGSRWARTIETTLANVTGDAVLYEAEQLSSTDALEDIDAHDSYFVHTLGFVDDDAFINATDSVPTVYTSQLFGPNTLDDRARTLGDPGEVVGDSDSDTWNVTADHPIFDGVADPGDAVLPVDEVSGYGAYFSNTSAELLATPVGDPTNGTVAVDDTREDVFLTGVGSGAFGLVEIENHSQAGLRVLVNALTEYVEGATGQTQYGNTGIGDATVDVAGTDQQVTTTDDGQFVLPLSAGAYTLEVSADGYETLTETVQVVDGVVTEHTFELTPDAASTVGDVDRDGGVDIVDAVLIQQHLAGMNPEPFDPVLADVDRDGGVDIVDAVRIQRLLAGLDDPGAAAVAGVDAPDSVTVGDRFTVSATVENTGDHGLLQAAEFRLAADSGGDVAEAVELVDLGPAASVGVGATIDTTGLDPGEYTLEVVTENDTETVSVTVTASSGTAARPPAGLSVGS